MVVASHNPSNLAMQTVEVLVPHENFKVQSFDGQSWVDSTASVICNDQQKELYPSETIHNCRLYVS